MLDAGLRAGLYSAAAAAIRTPSGHAVAVAGTYAAGDDRLVGPESRFDLASISKLATALIVQRLAESGLLDLDAPLAAIGFADDPRFRSVTTRMLLLHTSGYPAVSFLWRDEPTTPPEDRLRRVLATPLESAPDELFRYSDLGYIAAGALAESVTGSTMRDLVATHLTVPLGLGSISYGPIPSEIAVATEREDWVGRGVVRGEVHDELSWFLGGAVGHAGLFGSAEDVLDLVSSALDGTVLSSGPASLGHDGLEPRHGANFGQGLGARINDRKFMGEVAGIGQTGFTGTMWMAIPAHRKVGVLLTNRVHMGRDRVDLMPFRRAFALLLARS